MLYDLVDTMQRQPMGVSTKIKKIDELLDYLIKYESTFGSDFRLEKIFAELIKTMYLTTLGKDLTTLKVHFDKYSKCTTNCLTNANLIFDYLDTNDRQAVLSHFITQSKVPGVERKTHILTDIDDTVHTSRVGGTDKTYKDHTFYPGVFKFHEQVNTSDFTTYLSARPNIGIASFSERRQKEKLDLLVPQKLMPYRAHMMLGETSAILGGIQDLAASLPLTSILVSYVETPGRVESIIKNLNIQMAQNPCICSDISTCTSRIQIEESEWARSYQAMGINKYRGFCKLANVYPEFNFIFIGDSGQGDMLAALLIAQHPQTKLCLIRDIIRRTHSLYYGDQTYWKIHLVSDVMRSELAQNKVYVFNNYIDAALHLYHNNMLSRRKLKIIAKSVKEDFGKKTLDIYHNLGWLKDYKEKELANSLKVVKQIG
jgi:hypothetical protein